MKIKYAHECVECSDCGEPWCEGCEEHYAYCDCLGPHSEEEENDVVMVYCPACRERNDIEVSHPLANLEYYQLENLPEKISNHLETRKIICSSCNKKFTLEKQKRVNNPIYIARSKYGK